MNSEYKELLKVDEISEKTASILFEMGIKTPEELANANEEDIFKNWKQLKSKGKVSYLSQKQTIIKWINNAKTGEHKYHLAKIRYDSLKERTFTEALKMLIFDKIIINKEPDFEIDKVTFEFCNDTNNQFKESFKYMTAVRENNKIIADWKSNNKHNVNRLKQLYSNYFSNDLPYENFKKFYGEDSKIRQCKYCKIKEHEIAELLDRGKINTKRIYSRGKSLEIDRTIPNGKYIESNIELCCYWCNNAKTDEFDDKEFEQIGELIENIWEGRLKK